MMLTRRQAMIGAGATCLLADPSLAALGNARRLAVAPFPHQPGSSESDRAFVGLQRTLAGGRFGVAAIDLVSGRTLRHDADARYPFCSTFKLPLAAAILAEVAAGRLPLDHHIAITRADLVPHAPVVEEHLAAGSVSVEELCRGAMVFSDNAAANLLLRRIGGPAGLTRFMRAQGDPVSRLDHFEPALNLTPSRDPANTTSPAAMLALATKLLLGPALPAAARARLIEWMTQNDAGLLRLRAGLPRGWRAGSRTGTADGRTNDLLIAWPPGARAPVLAACYVDAPAVDDAARLAVQVAVGRQVAALVG